MFKILIITLLFGILFHAGAAEKASDSWKIESINDPVFGSKIRIMQAGLNNTNTVILIHGLGGEGFKDWQGVIPELQKHFHVLSLDLPGFGTSDTPKGKYSPRNYAKVIHALHSKYARGQVSVVGHSMGGAIALRYAADYPDELHTLVLVDAAGILHRMAYVKHMAALPIEINYGPKFLISTVAHIKDFSTSLVEKINIFSLPMDLLNESDTAWNAVTSNACRTNAALALVSEDFSEAIARLPHRTYILWGEQDRIAPLRTGKMLAERMQNASLHVFKGAGHAPILTHTKRFNALLHTILTDGIPRALKKKLPLTSSATLHCDNKAGVSYSGVYDEIIIKHSQAIKLINVKAKKIRVTDSLVNFENVSVLSENIALETNQSVIEMTNVTLKGNVAIHSEQSRLDMAGVSLAGHISAVTVGKESRLIFSTSDSHSRTYQGFVHGDYELTQGTLDAHLIKRR